MLDLIESIRTHGLIVPVIVRQIGDRYQMIAGHRRKHACELLGHSDIEAIAVNISDEEATIMMVDSNCQREKLLPSEKAFAYKMKLDAIKRQGKRTDLTSVPVAHKLKSRQIIAAQIGESQDQVRRYIRLTYLVPELLGLVDAESIKMRPAVELSYLNEEAQQNIVDLIEETQAYPTHAQAIRIRKAFEASELTDELARSIMEEEKQMCNSHFAHYYAYSDCLCLRLHGINHGRFLIRKLLAFQFQQMLAFASINLNRIGVPLGRRCDFFVTKILRQIASSTA